MSKLSKFLKKAEREVRRVRDDIERELENFGDLIFPDAPELPPPPEPPEPPTVDQDTDLDEDRRRRGRRTTILTSRSQLANEPYIMRPTLLGQ